MLVATVRGNILRMITPLAVMCASGRLIIKGRLEFNFYDLTVENILPFKEMRPGGEITREIHLTGDCDLGHMLHDGWMIPAS